MTQVRPVPVAGYSVQLVGYTSATLEGAEPGVAFARTLPIAISLDRLDVRRLLRGARRAADVVAVLVMQRDPGESVSDYARYALSVNGVPQPGG
jgi:hypothetical protein